MECPNCACELKCLRTIPLRDEKIRMRKCYGCGSVHYTSETIMNFYEGRELYNGICRDYKRKWRRKNEIQKRQTENRLPG